MGNSIFESKLVVREDINSKKLLDEYVYIYYSFLESVNAKESNSLLAKIEIIEAEILKRMGE